MGTFSRPKRRAGCPKHGVCAWVLGLHFLFCHPAQSGAPFAPRTRCHPDRSAAQFAARSGGIVATPHPTLAPSTMNSRTLKLLNFQLSTFGSSTSSPLFSLSPPQKSTLQFPRALPQDIPCPLRLHRQRLPQPHGRIHRATRCLRRHRSFQRRPFPARLHPRFHPASPPKQRFLPRRSFLQAHLA